LLPAAVFLLSPEASKAYNQEQSTWRLAVCCEGFENSVVRHLHDTQAAAKRIGLGTEILQLSDHNQLWEELRDFPLQSDRLVYRVTVPRALAAVITQTIHSWSTSDFRPRIICDTAMGVIWLSLEN
jgi:Tfp pilus assembly protein PilF